MNTLKTILSWLQGKKTTIVTLIAFTVSFLVFQHIISPAIELYVNGVLVILGFGANVATAKLIPMSKPLGSKKR